MDSEEMVAMASAAAAEQERAEAARREEEKQRRQYRVGLSYRCGRCGKPKKDHVCDMPDDNELGSPSDAAKLSPQPAILATTIRKGTPPALMGSPLLQGSPLAPPTSSPLAAAVGSPLADVK